MIMATFTASSCRPPHPPRPKPNKFGTEGLECEEQKRGFIMAGASEDEVSFVRALGIRFKRELKDTF